MLNKLLSQLRKYAMLEKGDRLFCAVSGGADSVALLFAMYLLRDKLGIILEAAHFNHGLRGAESDRDETFVRQFCADYGICCHVSRAEVKPGKKGLEAAARDARYAFFRTLPGKIATAHTADDNAETVLMHLIRGTGLKGLGGIAPVNGNVIRPMLAVTRQQVLEFLQEYHLSFVEDSSNATDDFLRNRLRHYVMPLLKQENPQLAPNLSAMAMELRADEEALACGPVWDVVQLRNMPQARRNRALTAFLEASGVKEPEREHVALAESLVFSPKPSAKATFPGGVTICRNYDRLEILDGNAPLMQQPLQCPGNITLPNMRISCAQAATCKKEKECFTVQPEGQLVIRPRREGDTMRLPGGSKSLKKLFIDRKIPAAKRLQIPVIADDSGVLGVAGIGPNLDRIAADGVEIRIEFFDSDKE